MSDDLIRQTVRVVCQQLQREGRLVTVNTPTPPANPPTANRQPVTRRWHSGSSRATAGSDDDFETGRPALSRTRILPLRCQMPSSARRRSAPEPAHSAGKEKRGIRNYSMQAICLERQLILPSIPIPRGNPRKNMEVVGQVRQLMVTSLDTEEEMEALISSSFRGAFEVRDDEPFRFEYLSSCGAPGSKRLTKSNTSSTFRWNGEAVKKLAGQGALYLMADHTLRLAETHFVDETADGEVLPSSTMGRNPAVLVSDSEDDLPPIYNGDTLPDLQNADTNSTVSGNLREMLNCAAALVLPVHGTRHTPGTNPPKDPWILDSINPRALPEWMVDDQEPLVPEPDLEWTALNDDSHQKRTADDVLQLLKGLVEDNQRMQTIRLRQLHVLEDMVRWTERGHLSYKFPVKIAFLGQTGIDDKGLTRQTATYLIQGLSRSPVFVGEVGRLTLTSDTSALVAKDGGQCRCEVTGRLVGFILTHAGLPVNLFSQSLARLLCGEYDCIDLADCPDGQLRGQIQKVKDQDPRTFPSNEAQDLAEAVGFHGLLTPTNKDVLIEASIAYRTSVSNRAQIQAFMKGLDETGVLSVLRGQSAAAVQLLSGSGIRPLTAGAVYDLFVVDFSVEGSNSRADEEIIMLEFSFFLQACEQRESSCSLADVLEFCSGSRTIPPGGLGGFNSLPTIAFRTSGLPTASTCACSLTLPRHLPENSTLKDVMEMAIVSSPNFDD